MLEFFHVAIYQPIYNTLAFIADTVAGGNIGIAIIIVTLLVRLALFPVSWAAIRTQIVMRRLDPVLKKLREDFKDNQEELAKRTMAVFKENKINPFASFLLILIQLPVIIGLYTVLRGESNAISFDPALLYPFVHAPEHTSLVFLGVIDLAGRSMVLAGLVAVSQFLFARLMAPRTAPAPGEKEGTFQHDLQKSMNVQMQYVFPVVMGLIAYAASAAIALYFVVSNTFSIGQELVVRHLNRNEQ